MTEQVERLTDVLTRAREQVGRVIIGQQQAVDYALIAIFTRQHALLEGVPGVAKTLLVRTLAHVLGCPFGRVQFTPDLMPSDITGTSVFDFQHSRFQLVKGPVFTSFLLADEINRAPAKTQAALLEAMQERSVTIDRQSFALPPDFTVFATQNPIEYEGTYPLPEAQKDRFLLKVRMDYPQRDQELSLAQRTLGDQAPERVLAAGLVQPVLGAQQLEQVQAAMEQITLREELLAYAVDLVRSSRAQEAVLVGAGPRASQALVLAARARAALEAREFVTPDDIREMAVPVLEHRLILRPEYEIEGLGAVEVIAGALAEVAVPR